MITGRLTIAVEYLEVHQMDMRRMSLPPWTFLIDEAPDLDIPKARLRLRAFRVESVTVNRPVDRWKVVLQLGAGTEGECPSPDGCLGSKSLDHAQAVGRSEEHTSELQSLRQIVCRLLLAKKKN